MKTLVGIDTEAIKTRLLSLNKELRSYDDEFTEKNVRVVVYSKELGYINCKNDFIDLRMGWDLVGTITLQEDGTLSYRYMRGGCGGGRDKFFTIEEAVEVGFRMYWNIRY